MFCGSPIAPCSLKEKYFFCENYTTLIYIQCGYGHSSSIKLVGVDTFEASSNVTRGNTVIPRLTKIIRSGIAFVSRNTHTDGRDKLLEWSDRSCLLLYVSARIH